MSVLVTKTAQATKVLDHPNIKNGEVEIQITWPLPVFADTTYTAVASSYWISASSETTAPNGIQEAGDRDRETTGMLVVLNLTSLAQYGDTINVDAIAIGYVIDEEHG
jgi:hypothetical protein